MTNPRNPQEKLASQVRASSLAKHHARRAGARPQPASGTASGAPGPSSTPRAASVSPLATPLHFMSLMEHFQGDEKCRAYLERLRWPDGVTCPQCQSRKISRIYARRQFHCDGCTHQFSVTAGTIFHDSHLPLPKWLAAVYLMTESRKGMSANQLKRTLEVSYKTAWYLCHRIRAAVKDADESMLRGTVAVDETHIGGKMRGMGRGYCGNKAMVLAAIQRQGAVRAEEWVRGDVHTNTVEGVFSLFKRSIIGAYHQVSQKHLGAYLDEFEFRFNNRENPYLFRDTLRKLLGAETLPYRKLVSVQ